MKINKNHIYALLLTALSISACSVGKDYQRPSTPLPLQFSAFADTSSIADIPWKDFFADTALQNLISQGISYNYDLQTAIKRIDIAQQQLKQARLLSLPAVDLQVSGQYSRPSKNGLNGAALQDNHIENYNAALNLGWEIDIWGRIRRQKEEALAEYLQTYEAARAVQTQLAADIAQGYFNLLMLDKQLAIVKRNFSLNDTTLQLTKLLKDAGEVNSLAVQQAEAQKQATAALIPRIELDITVQENALRILTGQLPDTVSREKHLEQHDFPAELKTGYPAAIISRRPDIRAAEMALKAANARVGIAQASMYPSLTITAAGGVESIKAADWFNMPGSLFGLAAGTVLQPIFRNRALKTRYETAKIEREQSVLWFRQSVLNAVGEVSNALAQTEKLKEQQLAASGQVETLRKAVKNAQLLFKSDMANYLEVITAQSSALQAELNLASIQRQRQGAVVELYRSLGGGWK